MSASTPLFILGHPRSGTTALAGLLNTAPEVACLYQEGNLLYRLWQTLQRIKVPEEPICDLLMDFEVTARYNLVHRTPIAHAPKLLFTEDSIQQLVQTYAQGLETSTDPKDIYTKVSIAFFDIFAKGAKAKIVGDKVPDYLLVPEHITAPHPDSLIISITRDPRAVIHSSLRFSQSCLHLFAVKSAFAMAVAYCLKQKCLESFLADVAPARVLSISQEELLTSPRSVLEKASALLKIPGPRGTTSEVPSGKTKNWQTEMAQEDKNAVTAVCCAFAVLGREKKIPKRWQEKAESIQELSSFPDDGIPELVQRAAFFFRGSDAEKRELGLTLTQLADYAHKRADFCRAESFFQQSASFIPHDPIFWYKYGLLCYDMKQYDKVLSCTEQSSRHCPATAYHAFLKAKNLYLAGMTEKLMGNSQKAERVFAAAVAAKPDFALPANMLQLLNPQKARTQ